MTRSRLRTGAGSVVVLTALLASLFALAPAAPAGAAEPVGSATFLVKPAKWRALERRGIELAGGGGNTSAGRSTRLQVSGGEIGSGSARISFGGTLLLSTGAGPERHSVRLAGLQAELGGDSALSARLGGKRRVFFDLEGGTLGTDPAKGSAQLRGARLLWRRGALAALDARLGARLPRGGLGALSLTVATVGGVSGPGDAPPQSGPISSEPPLLARPASAVNVTSATLAWHVRDSWIRYLNSQEAPQALEGASAEAPIEESKHPCPNSPAGANPTLTYSYDFPFANGWYDPASGTAALYYGGGVRFSYPSRGIDLTARNPEIEVNGASSRAIFRLRGAANTPYPDQRAAILDLTPSAPVPGPTGTFGFPAPIRGSLNADGQSVFAGFYPPPNNGFGCFSVSFSTAP